MALDQRRDICEKIEAHRKRPLIVYVTSKRPGIDASMATDVLPYLIDQLDKISNTHRSLDFLITSYGGDPMVAWRIMSLIRERFDTVSVLVPQSAYSAATLLALGANEIVMHPNGHLGPVDMQITTFSEGKAKAFSTEDISAFIDFVKENLGITDQRHLRSLFEHTCKEVSSTGVGLTARSSKLALALGEKLLAMHSDSDENKRQAKETVARLSRQFHSHGYPISRTEALEIGLSVNVERDPALEALMWELWLDLENELKERSRFSPIYELMSSNTEAAKLLAPVPQLELPANAPGPGYFSATLPDVTAASATKIDPVPFEHIDAIMESSRLAHREATRGKILASRLPDLNLQYNSIVSFRGWEKVSP